MSTKKCAACKALKPFADFHGRQNRKSGLSSYCRSCARIRNAADRAKDPLYDIWGAMIRRCDNPADKGYHKYGARGIRVCERWRVYENYRSDIAVLGARPSPSHSIDRIDNDGNYEPGNIRWATDSQQAINQRIRKDNTSGHKGVSPIGDKWAANVNRNGIRRYLGRHSTIEEAVAARIHYLAAIGEAGGGAPGP